jgi:hypothetical protein
MWGERASPTPSAGHPPGLRHAGVSRGAGGGSPRDMTPEREDPDQRDDLDELDEVIDEFGDRSGPAPEREPELELGEDEAIVEPAPDDE